MQKLSAELAVPIKIVSTAAGSALGGFLGKQIGGLAGYAVPVIGRPIGKTTGKYSGTRSVLLQENLQAKSWWRFLFLRYLMHRSRDMSVWMCGRIIARRDFLNV